MRATCVALILTALGACGADGPPRHAGSAAPDASARIILGSPG